MKKFSLSFLGDLLAVCFATFSISIVLLTYFLDYPRNLIFSLLFTAILSAIFCKILLARRKKQNKGVTDKKHFNQVILQLNYQSRAQNDDIIFDALLSNYKEVERKKHGSFIPSKNTLFLTRFNFDQIKKSEIIKVFNLLENGQKAVIFAENFSLEVIQFAKRFDGKIILKDGKDTYNLLSKHNNFPLLTFTLPESKKTNPFKIKNIFYKSKAKTFLGFGLGFMFFSFFVPFKIYYVVSGSIMLIIASICILFGKKDTQIDFA